MLAADGDRGCLDFSVILPSVCLPSILSNDFFSKKHWADSNKFSFGASRGWDNKTVQTVLVT